MDEKRIRTTHRRTLYTIGAIKDAMLGLLEDTPFDKITVAGLCRTAEITRTTFYLHFPDLTAVLDELLKDALQVAETAEPPRSEPDGTGQLLLPMCQRVADSPKYRVLFLDETLTNYIIKTIYQYEKQKILPGLMQGKKLSQAEAEMIFRFMLNGSFAVNKAMGWKKDERWYAFQQVLAKFIRGGLDELA